MYRGASIFQRHVPVLKFTNLGTISFATGLLGGSDLCFTLDPKGPCPTLQDLCGGSPTCEYAVYNIPAGPGACCPLAYLEDFIPTSSGKKV